MKLSKPFSILWKLLLALVLLVCILFCFILIFVGPIAEYAIEKYDEEYIGRRIEIDDLKINAFTGKLNILQFNMYEAGNDTQFVHFDTLDIKINVWKAISGKYDIERFILSRAKVRIIQSDNGFNFDDLMALGSDSSAVDTTPVDTSAEPLQYWLRKFELNNAEITYEDRSLGSQFIIQNIHFRSDTIQWDKPKHHYQFSSELKSGGAIALDFKIDIAAYDYQMQLQIDSFNLHAVQNYVLPYLNIHDFNGQFSLNTYAQGNFNKPDDLAGNCDFRLENFSMTDEQDRVFTSIEQFSIRLDTINTNNNMYALENIVLSKPYILFEMFSKYTNIDRLMKESSTTEAAPVNSVEEEESTEQGPFEMLAEYVASFAKDFNENEYQISSVKIVKGNIDYADYTMNDPFKVKLSQFNLSTSKISSSNPMVSLSTDALMNDKGKLAADAKISMKNYKNFNLNMLIEALPISSFNPYSTYFVAHPFWDGNIYFKSNNSIQNNMLKSDNVMRVSDIEVGKKIKNKTAADVPVRLGVALLRDRNGNIELELPIEGNLADPNYKIGKAIIKIVTNILVKAVTAPYDLLASSLKCDPNDLKFIAFDYTQVSPTEKQLKNVELIAKILDDKPGLNVEFTQAFNEEFEKDMIAIYAAKQKYATTVNALKADSIQVDKIETTDSLFVQFVQTQARRKDASLQEQCRQMYGTKELDRFCIDLANRRREFLKNYLLNQKKLSPARLRFNGDKTAEADAYNIGKFMINFYTD